MIYFVGFIGFASQIKCQIFFFIDSHAIVVTIYVAIAQSCVKTCKTWPLVFVLVLVCACGHWALKLAGA